LEALSIFVVAIVAARSMILTAEAGTWASAAAAFKYFTKCCVVRSVQDNEDAPHADLQRPFFRGLWGSCEVCAREYVCEHVLAVLLRTGEVTLPAGLAQFKGRKKRSRGRPAELTGDGRRYGNDIDA
jgi:hypothetical protein